MRIIDRLLDELVDRIAYRLDDLTEERAAATAVVDDDDGTDDRFTAMERALLDMRANRHA